MSAKKLGSILGLTFFVFLLAAVATLRLNRDVRAPATSATPNSSPPKPEPFPNVNADERQYFAIAGAYLKTANEQGMKVAKTMAGASTGESTLIDIEKAVSRASFVENAGYSGDYQSKVKTIPSLFRDDAKAIEEVHRLFQAAMTEYKKFFKTQSLAYIPSGQAAFKRCAALMNKTIEEMTKKMSKKMSK